MLPPKKVRASFKARGKPRALTGGQGTTYLVGDTVFKRVENETEAQWVIDTLSSIEEKGFRIPKFLTSTNDTHIVEGWIAYEFLTGIRLKGHWKEKRRALEDLHKSLKNIAYPWHFKSRMDPYSIADRMAWGEMAIVCNNRLEPAVEKITTYIKPLQLPHQIIQGDPGNMLFSEEEDPAIIDFSPYWRPRDFSLAVLIVDGLVWEGATLSIFEEFSDLVHLNQLLLRAELRRILELDGLNRMHGRDCLSEIDAHMPTIDLICARARSTKDWY